MKTLLGKKLGMTQFFLEDGRCMPVTVIELGPCSVLQIKTKDKDGYNALQIGYGERKEKHMNKPSMGRFKKAGTKPLDFIQEVRVDKVDDFKPGQALTVETFADVRWVDVIGITKGRGFAGGVRRHNFGGGPKTHGQSDRQRAPGAIGRAHSISQGVLKGKRMAGHMGNVPRTIKNISVVRIEPDKNLMYIHGAVPGPMGGFVRVCQADKEVNLRVQKKFKTAEQAKADQAKSE